MLPNAPIKFLGYFIPSAELPSAIDQILLPHFSFPLLELVLEIYLYMAHEENQIAQNGLGYKYVWLKFKLKVNLLDICSLLFSHDKKRKP